MVLGGGGQILPFCNDFDSRPCNTLAHSRTTVLSTDYLVDGGNYSMLGRNARSCVVSCVATQIWVYI